LDCDLLLSDEGIRQAKIAGKYIKRNFPHINIGITSPFLRAIQTASKLNLDIKWQINNLVFERDGGFRHLNDRSKKFVKHYKQNAYFVTQQGEEKLYSTSLRAAEFLRYTKHLTGKTVLVSTHNEFMHVMRSVIEELPVNQFLHDFDDKKIPNCGIMVYTRKNPKNPKDIKGFYRWRKVIDPVNPDKSWNDGRWTKIPKVRLFANEDLLEIIDNAPQKFSYKKLGI
jgi:broad specificity phosphatase PhoE